MKTVIGTPSIRIIIDLHCGYASFQKLKFDISIIRKPETDSNL